MTEEATWSVEELHVALNGLIEHAFGETIWVTGELRSKNRSPAGHTYFELIEPGTEGEQGAARLSVTLFRGHRQKVNSIIKRHGGAVTIEEGTVLRVSGELKTYAARSQLQLVMTGIDPSYTLAVSEQRRAMALAALSADGLLEANAQLPVAFPPTRVAVVTSRGSAAEADVLNELQRCRVGLHITTVDARTQGVQAEETLVAALRTAHGIGVDVILLVRGGGSAADLAAFDTERLGRTIATLGTAVFTGIGHETDRSVADEVAHSAFKTPTAAAAAVVDTVEQAESELSATIASLSSAVRGRVVRATGTLDGRTRAVVLACRGHLNREAAGVENRLARVAAAAPLSLRRTEGRLAGTAGRIGPLARATLQRAEASLEGYASLTAANDPVRLLERGWSITRDDRGDVVTSPEAAPSGSRLHTLVAGGKITSVVTAGDAPDVNSGPPPAAGETAGTPEANDRSEDGT